jgi:serine protease Do
MMRALRFLLIASVLCIGSFTSAIAKLPKIDDNLNATVVVIGKSSEGEIKRPKTPIGMGTGVVFGSDGLFVTNWHVIEKARNVVVFVYDKDDLNEYETEIIGVDKVMDIAILKIVGELPPIMTKADFGEDPQVGEDIYMIGHPQGMVWTVSKGIISHDRRFVETPWQRMIQTDALLMPGNSGGPLFNENGNIVGINTIIVPSADGTNTQAWSMSVHVEDVLWTIGRIMKYGSPRRPALNVDVSYNEDEKAVFLTPKDDSNLSKAGLTGEAKLVKISNTPVSRFDDLYKFLKTKKDGDSVTVTVEQNNVVKDYTFNLEVWEVLD